MSFSTSNLAIIVLAICVLQSIDGKPPKWLSPHRKTSKIVGGRNTTIQGHPYMVYLTHKGRFACGGSLVTSKCVLTASHCLEVPISVIEVRGGGTDLDDWTQSSQGLAKMTKNKYTMDVGVLKLKKPMIGDNMGVVDLDFGELSDEDSVTVVGWGFTETEMISKTLQEVVVPIIPRWECQKAFEFPLPKYVFCAGDDRKDSHKGDSGGPALRDGKQVGIVSFGETDVYTGVYTQLNSKKIKRFIEKALNQLDCY